MIFLKPLPVEKPSNSGTADYSFKFRRRKTKSRSIIRLSGEFFVFMKSEARNGKMTVKKEENLLEYYCTLLRISNFTTEGTGIEFVTL